MLYGPPFHKDKHGFKVFGSLECTQAPKSLECIDFFKVFGRSDEQIS